MGCVPVISILSFGRFLDPDSVIDFDIWSSMCSLVVSLFPINGFGLNVEALSWIFVLSFVFLTSSYVFGPPQYVWVTTNPFGSLVPSPPLNHCPRPGGLRLSGEEAPAISCRFVGSFVRLSRFGLCWMVVYCAHSYQQLGALTCCTFRLRGYCQLSVALSVKIWIPSLSSSLLISVSYVIDVSVGIVPVCHGGRIPQLSSMSCSSGVSYSREALFRRCAWTSLAVVLLLVPALSFASIPQFLPYFSIQMSPSILQWYRNPSSATSILPVLISFLLLFSLRFMILSAYHCSILYSGVYISLLACRVDSHLLCAFLDHGS